jgi:hypothetical protein
MADRPLSEDPQPSTPGNEPTQRVADSDRDRTVTLLREHVVEGRLTLDEFSQRMGLALEARTRGELDAVMADLPSPSPAATVATTTDVPRKKRRWHIAVMSGHSTKGRWRIGGKTNAVAIMGGCDMDLRRAEIEGPEVQITAFAFWGGIDIISTSSCGGFRSWEAGASGSRTCRSSPVHRGSSFAASPSCPGST